MVEGIRFWCGPPCYIHLSKETTEIQQQGRRDVVPTKDVVKCQEDDGFDIVLRAPQIFEARFYTAEVMNRALLVMCLMVLGAKVEM